MPPKTDGQNPQTQDINMSLFQPPGVTVFQPPENDVRTSYIVICSSFDVILGCFGNFQKILILTINWEKN